MKKLNNIQFNTVDYIIIATISMLLLSSWLYIIIEYKNLPETIAVHFDGSGNPNGYNDKSTIWLAPIIFTILSIALIFGAKYPEQINFPHKELTEKEKIASSKTVLFSSLLLSSILILITHSMIRTSIDINNDNNPMVGVITVIICLTILFLIAMFYYHFKF